MRAFNPYFDTRKNFIVVRAKFNNEDRERIDIFIQYLLKIANKELLRDRIVAGVLNNALSNDLKAKANLILFLAVQTYRQTKESRENQIFIRRLRSQFCPTQKGDERKTHLQNIPKFLQINPPPLKLLCTNSNKER